MLDRDNPFEMDNDEELAEKVKNYTETDQELDKHSELLTCGAQLAKNTNNALGSPLFKDLSAKQRYYLGDDNKMVVEEAKKEAMKGGKWVREDDAGFLGQSKYLKGSVLLACLAGIIQ